MIRMIVSPRMLVMQWLLVVVIVLVWSMIHFIVLLVMMHYRNIPTLHVVLHVIIIPHPSGWAIMVWIVMMVVVVSIHSMVISIAVNAVITNQAYHSLVFKKSHEEISSKLTYATKSYIYIQYS
jgi:hypothetical protein